MRTLLIALMLLVLAPTAPAFAQMGAGAAAGLEAVRERRFREQQEQQRIVEQRRAFALEQQRIDLERQRLAAARQPVASSSVDLHNTVINTAPTVIRESLAHLSPAQLRQLNNWISWFAATIAAVEVEVATKSPEHADAILRDLRAKAARYAPLPPTR